MRSMSLARRQNITSRGFNPRDPEPVILIVFWYFPLPEKKKNID